MRPPIGERYGRLVVVSELPALVRGNGRRVRLLLCRCDCGESASVRWGNLRNGHTQSCGCMHTEAVAEMGRATRRHGHAAPIEGVDHRTPTYVSWTAMLYRCSTQTSPDYANYGGRGIVVCDRWRTFENFLVDMGPRPSRAHSIDRIDVNGNYEPGNCRWATRSQQQRNKRNARYAEVN